MRNEPWMILFDVFGDSTRRVIFERLWRRAMPVGELAKGLPVSRSAVSQHLKVMKDQGLLRVRQVGVKRIYSIEPAGLWPLRSWIEGHMPRSVGGSAASAPGQAVQSALQNPGGSVAVDEFRAAGAGQIGLLREHPLHSGRGQAFIPEENRKIA
jgi:DNA-binding transcriptional ArsR family regulator